MKAFHTFRYKINPDGTVLSPVKSDADLLVMLLSALEWRNHNGEIHLITNPQGYEHLCENIGREGLNAIYDNISVRLHEEYVLNHVIDERIFWAGSKIFALHQVDSPCVMLDIDMIVWKPIKFDRLDAGVVGMHYEDVNNDYYPGRDYFSFYGGYSLPSGLDWNVKAMNTALAYFSDAVLKNEYCHSAISFMDKVRIKSDSIYNGLPYMLFAEQRLLPMIAKKHGAKISSFAELDWLFSDKNEVFSHIWGYKQYLRDHQEAHHQFCVDCVERIAYEFPDVHTLLKKHSRFSKYI